MSDYLPQEVLLEIFKMLPNKSIGRCMCVCKCWLSLIKNSSFISTHLNQSISSKKIPLFLLRLCSEREMKLQYSLHFDNAEFSHHMELEDPFRLKDQSFSLIGSCNGLVCFMHNLYTFNYSFFLWNPFIRKSITLPKPNITFESHGAYEALAGFGFDSSTNDYKVLRVLRLVENDQSADEEEEEVAIEVEIFSIKSNSWKSLTAAAPQYDIVERSSQAFVNGAVHWVATKKGKNVTESHNLVLALDMGNECFHELMLPKKLANENPMFLTVLAYKDSTIAVCTRNYVGFLDSEIWLMKEYGVEVTWTELLIAGIYEGGMPRALGFKGNGDVLFELHGGDIISVDPETLKIVDLGIQGATGYSFVDSFVETLVLLEQPSDTNDTGA